MATMDFPWHHGEFSTGLVANQVSCTNARIDKFKEVYKWMLPAYAVLHFIPPMVLKRKAYFKR
jgi:hypothetical protein